MSETPLTKTELIRTTQALQTSALSQCATLRGLATQIAGDSSYDKRDASPGLYNQLRDAEVTGRNHVQALQHAIDELTDG